MPRKAKSKAKENETELKTGINGNLTLQELLVYTKRFVNQQITQEEYDAWSSGFIVKAVIPSLQKMAYLINLVNTYSYSQDASNEMLICELYKNFFFHVYLGGYLDIQEIKEVDMTFENYDLLEPIFGPWIETYAKRDIEIMKNMLQDTLALSNGREIVKALNGINEEAINKQLLENKALLEFLDKDKNIINNLNNVAILNDPEMVEFLEKIKKESLKLFDTEQ